MTGTEVKHQPPEPGDPVGTPPMRRRAMQAEQTRRDILSAARRRFAAHGYAAATVKDVAADAGVSVQTVYDSVGGKPELVRQLNNLIDAEAGIGEIAARLRTETDPGLVVRVPAQITRRLIERCGDILVAALTASFAEPELAAVVDEGQRRHRAGAAAVAMRLEVLGALRPDVSREDATTTLAALADFRLALVLTDELGLDADQLEEWIATAAARSLLRPRRKRG